MTIYFRNGTIGLLALLLTGCFSIFNDAPANLINRVRNPSKTKYAILFVKEGNAVTDRSLQVSVKDIDDGLNNSETGNAFTADSNHGNYPLDTTTLKLSWKDDTHLNITYCNRLRTFKKANKANGIAITYQEF